MAAVEVTHPQPDIALITLNRPERLNTITKDLVAELSAALTEVDKDVDTRVVVLTGRGRGFCAGADLKEGYDGGNPPTTDVIATMAMQCAIAALVRQIHFLRQPVIAAVNGPAAGGGLALACASDIRIAARSAIFAVGFLRAGLSGCDLGVSWLLPRIVGVGRAHELMLTGRQCLADEALRLGLVTDVVDSEELLSAAFLKAAEINLNPPWSVELTKQGMWCSVESSSLCGSMEFENRQQVLTALTADREEAAAAFLEKRTPAYYRR